MRISNVSKTSRVSIDYKNGEVDWHKFANDIVAKANAAVNEDTVYRICKSNQDLIDCLQNTNPDLHEETLYQIVESIRSFQNNQLDESKWALPKNDKDVDVIVKNLKTGIKAGTAGHKMYNVLGDKGLYDLIGVLKTHDPKMDITAPVVNHVMQIQPEAQPVQYQESIRKLQESILNDARLACMVLQPIALLESATGDQRESVAQLLHQDLKELNENDMSDSELGHEKFRRLATRAKQIKLAPSNLKQYYMRKFTKNNLLETDDVTMATFDFIDQLKKLDKTNYDSFKTKALGLLHRSAINHKVDVQAIREKYQSLVKKSLPIKEATQTTSMLDLAYFIDGIGQIIRWDQTYMDFKKELATKFDQKFANKFTFLTHEGDSKDFKQDNVSAIAHRLDVMEEFGGPGDAEFIKTVQNNRAVITDLAKASQAKFAKPKTKFTLPTQDQNKKQARNVHFNPNIRLKKRNFLIGKYNKPDGYTAHYWFKQIEDAAKPIIATDVDGDVIELSQVENSLANSIDFRRLIAKSGISMTDAIEHIKNVVEYENPNKKINEDVVPFPGNKNAAVKQIKPARVLNMSPADLYKIGISDIVTYAHNLITDTDWTQEDAKWHVVEAVEHAFINAGFTVDQFLSAFEKRYGVDFHEMLHGKEISDLHRQMPMSEAISSKTAKACRQDLWKTMRRLVDSSNLSMMSNFESFEDKDKIVLKMAVYEPNPKKMAKIAETVKAKLKKEGWKHDANQDRFIKGDAADGVMVSIQSPRKTFRSGAYKNREVLTLPVEIIGAKKPLV